MQKMTPAMDKRSSDARERPHLSFDRTLHAAIARFTAGLSPSALFQAYADWTQHLLFSPDKQLELAERVRAGTGCSFLSTSQKHWAIQTATRA